jgi:hypothetical protein
MNFDEHKCKSVIEDKAKGYDRLLWATWKWTSCRVSSHDSTHIGIAAERLTTMEGGDEVENAKKNLVGERRNQSLVGWRRGRPSKCGRAGFSCSVAAVDLTSGPAREHEGEMF